MTLKHSFVSPITDGGDASLVGPDEWNSDHSIVSDLKPDTDDGATLGTALKQWSDLYMAGGAVIYCGGAHNIEMDSSGRVILGGYGNVTNHTFQVAGSSARSALIQSGNVGTGPSYLSYKTRNAVPTAHTILQDSDITGGIFTFGSDGSAFQEVGSFLFKIDGTPSVGTSMPGKFKLSLTPSGSVFSIERISVDNGGNFTVGTAAVNTNATDGFIYIPTCAGTPTGTPTTKTGLVPIVYDSTNHERYVYDGGWCVETQRKRVSADVSYTSTTTLADITGLSANVLAGRTYHFRAHLLVKSGASAGGVKAAISGTATATDIRYDGWSKDTGGTGTHAYTQANALGGAVAASTPTSDTTTVIVEGVITVNVAGTLTAQAAQNASNGTATVIARGSTLIVTEVA